MHRIVVCLALLLHLLSSVARSAATESWTSYLNERYGFCLNYPGELVPGKMSESGAGGEFHTPDGEFSVNTEASAFILNDESLDARWRSELQVLGKSVTYKQRAATWYVISGVTADGAEYYHKFYTRKRNWVAFWIHYPHAQAAKYEPWVTRIEKSFVPFRRGKVGAIAELKARDQDELAKSLAGEPGAPAGTPPPSVTPQPTPEAKRAEPKFIAPPPLGAKLVGEPSPPPRVVAPAATPGVTPKQKPPRQVSDSSWHISQPNLRNYPVIAKYGGIEGSGVVKISTDGAGRVTSVEIVQSANPMLDAAIKEHARRDWRGPPNSSRTVPFHYRKEQ